MHLSRPRWTILLLTCLFAEAVSDSRSARFHPWERLPRTLKKVALLRRAHHHRAPRVPRRATLHISVMTMHACTWPSTQHLPPVGFALWPGSACSSPSTASTWTWPSILSLCGRWVLRCGQVLRVHAFLLQVHVPGHPHCHYVAGGFCI